MTTTRTRIGIVGYGNLGRGAHQALERHSDLELRGVFTRRDPADVKLELPNTTARPLDELLDGRWQGELDVLVLCGGSKDDLPCQTPQLAALHHVVDSFDTHAAVPEHFAAVDAAAKEAGTVGIIGAGWDPGLFSVNRLYAEAIMPAGTTNTFWGHGLSQGHSDAVRRVPGVAAGVQYTTPKEEALEAVRAGTDHDLGTRDRHIRTVYAVLEDGADGDRVREAIVTMPNYFADYDTTVHFVSASELAAEHSGMPHGGLVLHNGTTGLHEGQVIEYSLKLSNNPEFTASVLLSYARAAYKLAASGFSGASTPLEVAPALLSPHDPAELRRRLL